MAQVGFEPTHPQRRRPLSVTSTRYTQPALSLFDEALSKTYSDSLQFQCDLIWHNFAKEAEN